MKFPSLLFPCFSGDGKSIATKRARVMAFVFCATLSLAHAQAQTETAQSATPPPPPATPPPVFPEISASSLEKSLDDIKPATKPKSDKWTFSLLPISFQKNPALDFTVITEMTEEGKKLPAPSAANPVYYISFTKGQRDQGGSYAGSKTVAYEEIAQRLKTTLASAGYRPCDPKQPEPRPTQILIFHWGEHNHVNTLDDLSFVSDGSDSDGTPESPIDRASTVRYRVNSENYPEIMSRALLVGGKKFAKELDDVLNEQASFGGRGVLSPIERFSNRDNVTHSLVEQVFDDCYYMVVSSYDYAAFSKPDRERILLWRTKMTTASQGVSLAQTIPGMLDNSCYYFGREMNAPEVLTKRLVREGKVKIGEAVVQEYIGTSGTTPVNPPPENKRAK